jgi:acetyl-CoA acetyltransferase
MANEVAILGVGMHPWGKWGRNFVEYGVKAARDALADAGLEWSQVQFIAGGETVRNGYPGFVAGASVAQALGWSGAQVASTYGACASGSQAINTARAHILAGLCDVALVVGADAAIARTIPTGCASGCWAPPTPSTSGSTRAVAWSCTAPPSSTSPGSR